MKFKHKETGLILETEDVNTFNLYFRNGFEEYTEPVVVEKHVEIVEVKQAVKPVRKSPGRPKK